MKMKTKRISILSLLMAIALLFACFAFVPSEKTSAKAAEGDEYIFDIGKGDVKIGNNINGVRSDGTHIVQTRKNTDVIIITGTTKQHNILLDSNKDLTVTVILRNVSIDTSNRTGASAEAAVQVVASNSTATSGGTVIIKLEGNNTLISGTGRAGIEKCGQPIQSNDNDRAYYNTLIVGCTEGIDEFRGENNDPSTYNHSCSESCGTLYVKGGDSDANASSPYKCGAGIGTHSGVNGERMIEAADGRVQAYDNTLRNLYIVGGNITAVGGAGEDPPDVGGAGIGTGSCESMQETGGSVENLNILGGNITAIGGSGPASCIGGGYRSGYVTLSIYGGVINAVEKNRPETNNSGAGIGGGGGGNQSGAVAGATVNIYNGTITAQGKHGAAIGAGGAGNQNGSNAMPASVNISGGKITATTLEGGYAAAIGTGGPLANGYSATATINITGGEIIANSASGADIGGGGTGSVHYEVGGALQCGTGGDANISISGASTIVKAQSGGIGGGRANEGKGGDASIYISGGTITAMSIGGGYSVSGNGGDVSELTVTGGELVVDGIIGGGNSVSGHGGNVTDFTVENVTVRAGAVGGGNSQNGNGGDIIHLAINNGTLNVNDTIGGGNSIVNGNGGSASIIVESGSLKATNIGGGTSQNGDGGEASLTINGGALVATNIGGGDSVNGDGGKAILTINGGTLTASNIGGGYSENHTGGEAELTVEAGSLNADSVGGGNSNNGDGGMATVVVRGGRFTVINEIGGGTSVRGEGGYCQAHFSGGTIRAYAIGAGLSQENGYADSNIVITGGTLNSMMTTQPTNGRENGAVEVFQTTVTLYANDKRIEDSPQVESLRGEACRYYGFNDVYLDESAMLYLWIPESVSSVKEIEVEGYEGVFAGIISGSDTGVLKYVSSKNYYSIHFPFDDRYTVSYDKDGRVPIKGIWAAAMGEAVSFYVHPKEYVPGQYYDITAFRSNDETYQMEEFQEDGSSTASLYYYKMTVTSDTEIIIAASGGGSNRISLDLSQNSIVLNETTAAIGGYALDLTGVTDYLFTSGGLPTHNTLRVEGGEHDLYTHWMNAYGESSIVEINVGTINMTVSETDNNIVSTEAAPFYIADGAKLNIHLDGADSLALGCERADAPAIDGEGSVYIERTGNFGFLELNTTVEGSDAQIKAKEFAYMGKLDEANGNVGIPYNVDLQNGRLVGAYDWTNEEVVLGEGITSTTTKYTAFTVSFELPSGLAWDPAGGYAIEDGKFVIYPPEGYYAASLYHYGVKTEDIVGNTLKPEHCRGDCVVVIVAAEGITFLADDVSYSFDGEEQLYPEILVVAGRDVKSDSIRVTYGTSPDALSNARPGLTNVGNVTVYYKIVYTLINGVSKEERGSAAFEIVKGTNEWNLELICGTIIKGEEPRPHAEAKWGNEGMYFRYRTYDVSKQTWSQQTDVVPFDSGLYEVQAFVPAETVYGNYDELVSDPVVFVIDPAAIFYTLGKEYTKGYQGYENGIVELDKFKVFTAYYGYYYTPSVEHKLTFLFTKPDLETTEYINLPAGTKITLLRFDGNGLKAYYYEISGNEVADEGILSTMFIDMGSMTANGGFEPNVTVPTECTIKICIELPKTFNDSFNVLLKQGVAKDYVTPELIVSNGSFADATVAIDGLTQEKGPLFATFEVANAAEGDNVLAVEVLDGDGNVLPVFVEDMQIYISGGAEFVGVSGNRIFFNGIQNGTYEIRFGLQRSIPDDESVEYTLRAMLCEKPHAPIYPMDTYVAEDEETATVVGSNEDHAPFITVSSTNRIVTAAEGITIRVTYGGEVPAGTLLQFRTYKVVGTQAQEVELSGMPEAFASGTDVRITLDGVEKGTYFILFNYGGTTYRYAFIVTE